MPNQARLSELNNLKAALEEKLSLLRAGDAKAEIREGDGRQEAAIHRTEKHLRDVAKEIEAEAAKPGGDKAKKK